jgi:hypothetical protein
MPDGRVWLRVADPDWKDPLDPSFARQRGGRWNPPGSFATLYLNGDVLTARQQIHRMLAGTPVTPDDLEDGAYVLVAARLPRRQTVADAVTDAGLRALGLPVAYPDDGHGAAVPHSDCQLAGVGVREARLRGVFCRSAMHGDKRGRELAWFPATRRSVARSVVWDEPRPFGEWRDAAGWTDLGLNEQKDPI